MGLNPGFLFVQQSAGLWPECTAVGWFVCKVVFFQLLFSRMLEPLTQQRRDEGLWPFYAMVPTSTQPLPASASAIHRVRPSLLLVKQQRLHAHLGNKEVDGSALAGPGMAFCSKRP